jgi:ankyrin repeat protein
LINEKSAIFELLSTSCYLDFNILNFLMKKRKPCINSGNKLPLNQSILRGNPFIIKSLIEYGRPHPFLRDHAGKNAIHLAAIKLDMDTLDSLITDCGADALLPDADGNTILHLLALGVIRDAEYDFVKQVIQKYNMRLTRNLENRTPLGIIRSYSQKGGPTRGQPNFKRKLLEFLETFIAQDPSFQDAD